MNSTDTACTEAKRTQCVRQSSGWLLWSALVTLVVLPFAAMAKADVSEPAHANNPPVATNQSAASAPKTPSLGLLDQFRHNLATTLDSSARWVDGLFGPEHYANDSEGTNGRLSVRTVWREYRDFETRTQFQVHLPLDNISRRLHAFVGKGSAEEIIEDKNRTPSLSQSKRDNDWLAGFGYIPPWSKEQRFSLSAGVALKWPPEPYVRGSYKYQQALAETVMLRLTESVFWTKAEQFGCSTSLDVDWSIRPDLLVRFPTWIKIAGDTEGAAFDSRAQLYHNLKKDRAILYGVGMQGDTKAKVPVRQYGIYGVYRQKLLADWFIGELLVGAGMLREDNWTQRKFSIGAGLGFELAFDSRPAAAQSTLATNFFRRDR